MVGIITALFCVEQTDDSRVRAVEAAVTEIQRIMHGETAPDDGFSAPVAAPLETAVYAGFEAPPEFGLASRLRGPGEQPRAVRVWVLVQRESKEVNAAERPNRLASFRTL